MTDDYILLKKHRHNGVWRIPGTTLHVSTKLGDWLVQQNIARRAGLIVPAAVAAPKAALLQPKAAAPRNRARRCCGW